MAKHPYKASPIFIALFIMALVFYVASVCAIHSDLYRKVCVLEHKLAHMQDARGGACLKDKL